MKYMKLGSKPDAFHSDENNVRYAATELASDITIHVGDVKFHLHKFPLLSKSSLLKRLVATISDDSNQEIHIPDIPGGPAAFEICAKFCYGMIVTLNAYNVVAARCAAEFLGMNENNERGNLIYKIEVFLTSSIFRSWKDSIIVLQTARSLLPWSEDLKLISHCIDAIASKASIDPSEVEWSYTYNKRKLLSENGVDTQWNGVIKQQSVPIDWWVEDLCEIELDLYKRVILSIKAKGRVSVDVIGEALIAYTYKRLPNFAKGTTTIHAVDATKGRMLLETIIWLLPTDSRSVSCSFLLKLVRSASLVDCAEPIKKELVKRIGRQLHEASVSDLLISGPEEDNNNTMYDVDLVMNILEEFVMQESSSIQETQELQEIRSLDYISPTAKLAVSQLIDGYLAEIAKDPTLPISKFVELAEMVSDSRGPVHDGLYRAIDTYLKEHPALTKSERKKLCSLMDCRKLSADACMHAVQNEQLPLRVVVQILFFEQVRASSSASGDIPPGMKPLLPRENGNSYGSSRSGTTTNTTNDDDWNAAGDSLKSIKLVGRSGGNERSSGGSSDAPAARNAGDERGIGKMKGVMMPKKLLNKIWSSKGQSGENSSSSDTSESPGSFNQRAASSSKSTPSRNTRQSVS